MTPETLVKEARITHAQAKESLRRLINSHFHPRGSDVERARVSIPARPDYDDDLILSTYVKQQAALEAAPPSAGGENAEWSAALGCWTCPHCKCQSLVTFSGGVNQLRCVNCKRELNILPPTAPVGEGLVKRLRAEAKGLQQTEFPEHWRMGAVDAMLDAAAALSNPEPSPDVLALVLCKSGKFETGQGTCALACMDQLGDPRKSGCAHASHIHRKLAEQLLGALRTAAPSPTPPDVVGLATETERRLNHAKQEGHPATVDYLRRVLAALESRALTGQAAPKGDGL